MRSSKISRNFARNNGKKVRINKKRFIPFVIIIVMIIAFVAWMLLRGSDNDSTENSSTEYTQGVSIMLAAKAYINEDLVYDPSYYAGYPPEGHGVCTDVIWKAMLGIDVDLKQLVDDDIERNFSAYSDVISMPDPSIDFRNVPVLEVFLQRHAKSLSINVRNLLSWQPGDIVVFESSHIAIVSNLRNEFGEPYIIQHGKDPAAEEDRINASDGMEISGHYRWNVI